MNVLKKRIHEHDPEITWFFLLNPLHLETFLQNPPFIRRRHDMRIFLWHISLFVCNSNKVQTYWGAAGITLHVKRFPCLVQMKKCQSRYYAAMEKVCCWITSKICKFIYLGIGILQNIKFKCGLKQADSIWSACNMCSEIYYVPNLPVL